MARNCKNAGSNGGGDSRNDDDVGDDSVDTKGVHLRPLNNHDHTKCSRMYRTRASCTRLSW